MRWATSLHLRGHCPWPSSSQFTIRFLTPARLSQPWCCWHLGPDWALFWGCPVHCGMFSSVLGFYPLDASRSHPHPHAVPTRNISRHHQTSSGESGWELLMQTNFMHWNIWPRGQGDLGSNQTLLLTSPLTLPKLPGFLYTLSLPYENESHYISFIGLVMMRILKTYKMSRWHPSHC